MSKSKAAARDKLSSMAAVIPQAPPVREIVPGRFTEKDWREMINDEIDVDVMASILDEVVAKAWGILYQKAIEKALWPYTADWVRDTVETIVEWQFLERDEGETDTHLDPNWIEDEEPVPAEIDTWARGAVPKTKVMLSRSKTPQIQTDETQPEVEKLVEEIVQPSEDKSDETPIIVPIQSLPPLSSNLNSSVPRQRKKKVTKVAKQKEKVDVSEGDTVDQATETATQITVLERRANDPLHASSSILRAQRGRPPGRKDVIYDGKGNVTQAVRLHPANFPSHRARTRFAVVDKANTQFDKSSRAALYRPVPPQLSRKPPERRIRFKGRQQIDSPQEPAPLSVSLIDSISLSAGVVIREGGRTKEGAKTTSDSISGATFPLQPIAPLYPKDLTDPGYVSSGSFIIRPVASVPVSMPDRRPIPPIANSNRHQNVST